MKGCRALLLLLSIVIPATELLDSLDSLHSLASATELKRSVYLCTDAVVARSYFYPEHTQTHTPKHSHSGK
uniref:Putative secreted protein n=1 Tax=Anopheles triannulatus TaxID=58253 RepID=A0A2M4B5W6_9DIPT